MLIIHTVIIGEELSDGLINEATAYVMYNVEV